MERPPSRLTHQDDTTVAWLNLMDSEVLIGAGPLPSGLYSMAVQWLEGAAGPGSVLEAVLTDELKGALDSEGLPRLRAVATAGDPEQIFWFPDVRLEAGPYTLRARASGPLAQNLWWVSLHRVPEA
jgi:hypothetical protein